MSDLKSNTIFLKLLIILFIFHYFDTVYSFTNPADLKKYYKANVKQMRDVAPSFCNISKTKWAGTCNDVFKKLREDDMYKYKLFVSYKPFAHFNESLQSKCIVHEMFFESSLEEIGDSRGVVQFMMPCFGRPALVQPNVPYSDYEYYYEFMIFAAGEDSMYVFKYNRDALIFYLLERFENVRWNDDSIAINPELFTLPPPEIIDGNNEYLRMSLVNADLFTMSTDPKNIINANTAELHFLIITTLLKYFVKDDFYVPTPEDKIKRVKSYSKIYHLRIFLPVTEQPILKDVQMYACPIWNCSARNGILVKPDYTWKIAAAITPDSVFILREIRNTRYFSEFEHQTICQEFNGTACRVTAKYFCRIVGMIRNLHPKYISYII